MIAHISLQEVRSESCNYMVDLPTGDPTFAAYASIYMLDPFPIRLLSPGNEKHEGLGAIHVSNGSEAA